MILKSLKVQEKSFQAFFVFLLESYFHCPPDHPNLSVDKMYFEGYSINR